MRLTICLLVFGCAPEIADDVVLIVPARDLAEHHVQGPEIRLAVPAEQIRAAPRPRRPPSPVE